MSQTGFWHRIGSWFRSGDRSEPDAQDLPPVRGDGLLKHGANDPNHVGRPRVSRLSKRRQREQALDTLQDGYLQVIQLIGSIHQHLESQDQRSRQIAEALVRLAENTSHLPEAADNQTEKLQAIASQIEAGNDRARRWEQSLLELPRLAEGQREALTRIGDQLERTQASDQRMTDTLEGLRGAVSSWGESSTAATEVMKELHGAASQRDERLDTLISAQHKRFGWLCVVMALLVVIAAATGAIALFK